MPSALLSRLAAIIANARAQIEPAWTRPRQGVLTTGELEKWGSFPMCPGGGLPTFPPEPKEEP